MWEGIRTAIPIGMPKSTVRSYGAPNGTVDEILATLVITWANTINTVFDVGTKSITILMIPI